jgi:hypothetical protein
VRWVERTCTKWHGKGIIYRWAMHYRIGVIGGEVSCMLVYPRWLYIEGAWVCTVYIRVYPTERIVYLLTPLSIHTRYKGR